ncbi:hypothetical protein D3C87_86360 [compost metagenome]
MKHLLWITLLIMTTLGLSVAKAQLPPRTVCGEYEVQGTIRKSEKDFVVKLYEGSISEVVFTLAPDLNELASIYPDTAITLRAKLLKPVEGFRGHLDSLKTAAQIKEMTEGKAYSERFARDDMKERVPDPLHPEMDSSFKLIKELPCSGEKSKTKKPPIKK